MASWFIEEANLMSTCTQIADLNTPENCLLMIFLATAIA